MSINELTMKFEQMKIETEIDIEEYQRMEIDSIQQYVENMEIDSIQQYVENMEIDSIQQYVENMDIEKKPKRKITLLVRFNKRTNKGPKKSIIKMRR